MTDLRKEITPEINLSVLEAERDCLEREIDQIIFDLYGLNSAEQGLINETVRGA